MNLVKGGEGGERHHLDYAFPQIFLTLSENSNVFLGHDFHGNHADYPIKFAHVSPKLTVYFLFTQSLMRNLS